METSEKNESPKNGVPKISGSVTKMQYEIQPFFPTAVTAASPCLSLSPLIQSQARVAVASVSLTQDFN